jgi:hypothetical protein
MKLPQIWKGKERTTGGRQMKATSHKAQFVSQISILLLHFLQQQRSAFIKLQ